MIIKTVRCDEGYTDENKEIFAFSHEAVAELVAKKLGYTGPLTGIFYDDNSCCWLPILAPVHVIGTFVEQKVIWDKCPDAQAKFRRT